MRFPIPLQRTGGRAALSGTAGHRTIPLRCLHTLAVFRLAPTFATCLHPEAAGRFPACWLPRAFRRGRHRLLDARSNACGVPSPRPALWRGPARTAMRFSRSGGAHGVHAFRSFVPARASALVFSTTHTPPAVPKTSASMILVEGPVAEFVLMLCDRTRDIYRGSWVFPRGQSAPDVYGQAEAALGFSSSRSSDACNGAPARGFPFSPAIGRRFPLPVPSVHELGRCLPGASVGHRRVVLINSPAPQRIGAADA